ncbi:glycosyltransferase family 4 protein [Lentisphaerota bacterium WC36G]|nr:glycosyltransferase family 4 protein [Lentisphaerae bacterium WC36]
MNILLIRRNFTSISPGGAERAATEIAFGLIKRGHCVTILSEKFAIDKEQENHNLKWIKVPKKRSLFSGTYSFHKQAQKIIKNENLREKFEITFSLCRTYPVDVMRVTEQIHHIWLPMNYHKIQSLNPRHSFLLKLEKELFTKNKAKNFIVISQLFKTQLMENFDVPEEKISVIYNGLDHDKFYNIKDDKEKLINLKAKYNIPSGNTVFVFVAHNFKIKGLPTVLEALLKLDKKSSLKNLSLLIVGKDNATSYLNKINNSNLNSIDIKFLGLQRSINEIYQISDLLVYPGSFETFGNVITEAMACGVPAVTSKLVGASEIINHKKNGYFLENCTDSSTLAAYLNDFLNLNTEQKKSFTRNAIKTAQNFDWNKNVESIEKLFIKIANKKN